MSAETEMVRSSAFSDSGSRFAINAKMVNDNGPGGSEIILTRSTIASRIPSLKDE